MIGLGVAAGANKPRKSSPIIPGKPCSTAVGDLRRSAKALRRVHGDDADFSGAVEFEQLAQSHSASSSGYAR